MSAGRSPSLAILNHIFRYPTIGVSPDRLANTTSPILGCDWITAQAAFRQGTERCAGLGIGQPCSSSRQIDFRPSQAQHFTASPSRQDHQPCGRDGWLPDLLLSRPPPVSLTGIVFGCETPKSKLEHVISVIRQRKHRLTIFSAIRQEQEFALAVEQMERIDGMPA